MCLVVMCDLLALVGLGEQYNRCNQSGQPDNICKDGRWCAAPEIYTVSDNHCYNYNVPYLDPYDTVTQAILEPNADFLWLFYTSVVYFFLNVGFVVFFGLVFCMCPLWTSKKPTY